MSRTNISEVRHLRPKVVDGERLNPFSESREESSVCLTEDSEFYPLSSEYNPSLAADEKANATSQNRLSTMYVRGRAANSKETSKRRGFATCLLLSVAAIFGFCVLAEYSNRAHNAHVERMDHDASVLGQLENARNSAFRQAKSLQNKTANAALQAAAMNRQEAVDTCCFFSLLGVVSAFIGMDLCAISDLCTIPGVGCCGGQAATPEQKRRAAQYPCFFYDVATHLVTVSINCSTLAQLCLTLHGAIDEVDSETPELAAVQEVEERAATQ